MKYRIGFFELGFCAALALTFVACSDDSSSSSNGDDSLVSEVPTKDDLVHCTKSHVGEIAHVLETDSIYKCTSEGWVLADSSIIEMTNSTVGAKSSSSVKASASDVEKIDAKKVESVTVKGLAELGPFVSGSVVTIYALDSALATGKDKFAGKTQGDSGRFNIDKVSFESQYAMVEVSGFFKNLMTGKKTSGVKSKLHAIVDLSSGKTVNANVNVFTEMEYARVKKLVLNDKFNVPAAKKRATQEILALFGGSASEGLTSTAISLADTGSVGSALYAALVMLQGDLSISKFNAQLSTFVEDFAEDGSWDDAKMRAQVADYLSGVDGKDGFAAIRDNMKSVVANVPAFETFLTTFWNKELGLGECVDSLETTIVKVKNSNSDLKGAGFACTSKRWHKTSDLDTELGLCTAKMEGEFKESALQKSPTYFTCKSGEWKEISKTAFELKSCTDKRNEEYVQAESGEMFVCVDKQWQDLDSVTFELKLCKEDRNEKMETTKKGETYACVGGKWVEPTEIEKKLGQLCLPKNLNDKEKLGDKYYICKADGWNEIDKVIYNLGFCFAKTKEVCETGEDGKYYECTPDNDYSWVESNELHCEVGDCSADAKDREVVYKNETYRCNGNEWDVCGASAANKVVGDFACVDSTINEKKTYVWREASPGELLTRAVCNEKLKSKSSSDWVYDSDSTTVYSCIDECEFEQCEGHHLYSWVAVSEEEVKTGISCTEKVEGTFVNDLVCSYSYDDLDYVWRTPSSVEKYLSKLCNALNINEFLKGYVCDDKAEVGYEWRKATRFESLAGFVCSSNKASEVRYYNNKRDSIFICGTDGKWQLMNDKITDSRDGKTYKTIKIGTQTWMAENLRYADSSRTPNLKGQMACLEDKTANCDLRGAMYSFSAAMNFAPKYASDTMVVPASMVKLNHQGICPTGWHIPTLSEFGKLVDFVLDVSKLSESNKAAKELINLTDWIFSYTDENGTHEVEYPGNDSYGFNVLRGGTRRKNLGKVEWNISSANYWTTDIPEMEPDCNTKTEVCNHAGYIEIMPNSIYTSEYGFKERYISVRCLKN